MRRSLFLLVWLGVTLCARAVPARPVVQTVCMADGTQQEVVLRGDESFHFYTTQDGRPVRQNSLGLWERDDRDINSRWSAARLRRRGLRQMPWLRRQIATHGSVAARGAVATSGSVTASDRPELQSKRALLVLVNFRDVRMKYSSTPEVFRQMTNDIGNPYGKNYGSVREYFRAQSYGQFDVEFDVVGPVSLSKKMEYYGADSGSDGDDIRPAQMVIEALNAVDEEVDFSLYDWDGNGEVENIFLIYAGYSQAQGASANTIWPHQWTLSEAVGSTLRLDGVIIDTYACSSELMGVSGNTIDGIGTMCHEYSHCLGLPDFYDTNYKAFGMSYWSVMDNGCNVYNGFCPVAFTAYERWFCGWMEPVTLDSACTVTALRNLEAYPEAYVIYNDNNPNEYYLLSNVQQEGWDYFAYGHGMMILHVDYDQTAWYENTVNNVGSHQRMTLIPADNKLSQVSSDLKGDLWPGPSGQCDLTDTTRPAARIFTANTDGARLMHKPIYGIAESNGIVSFRFMQEEADGVQSLPAAVKDRRPALYDLNGRRRSPRDTRSGIYVSQGRKVFIP